MSKLAIEGGKPVSAEKIALVKPTFSQKDAEDITKILKSAYVRMGPYTKEFEEKFAERVGAKYAYAVSNGTAALHCAYLSALKPGDEVIAPAFTFIATISTVMYSNAKPILADVEPDTFLLDPEKVKEKITKKTKAIAPVHLFGNSCDMKTLTEIAEDHKLLIINDCAQAHGTEYAGKDLGAWPNVSCYSFYPTKTMTTGEGGIVTTNDPELNRLGSLLRSHGDDGRYHHVLFGLNYRTTDIMSAIGLNQLSQLDDFLAKRRHNADVLLKGLKKVDGVTPQKITPKTKPSYSYFSVVLDPEKIKCNRDEFMKALMAENIDCGVHYPTSLTEQPVVRELLKPKSCPVSEDLSKRIMSLPMHPYLSDTDLDKVLKGVSKVANNYIK
ncbi:TPA: DegT/DnrJ/EryC1/StrS family aminotransferase [Candidatus Bathyarchaeota archaeon]|nr:DegT/DnrJ/EryC1/StrS family aminotransferase [Candidatus Bathyarchaeota archaeon]